MKDCLTPNPGTITDITGNHYDLICLVSNDLTYDRRMLRICKTLTEIGWKVLLLGRKVTSSVDLRPEKFDQHRVQCTRNKGFLFYAELPLKFRIFLKSITYDRIIFVDLDTVLTAHLIRKDNVLFVLDLHEYFENVPELINAFFKKIIWQMTGKISIYRFDKISTVNNSLAAIFRKKYRREVQVIRNVPNIVTQFPRIYRRPLETVYLGVLNPGRGLEVLIDVISERDDVKLKIIGDGPLSGELRERALGSGNIEFVGAVSPGQISHELKHAHLGWNLLESNSLSYYYSLANKFFDYINHGIPVITMNFPEYHAFLKEYNCGIAIDQLSTSAINVIIQNFVNHPSLWQNMHDACKLAIQENNWELESKKLLEFLND